MRGLLGDRKQDTETYRLPECLTCFSMKALILCSTPSHVNSYGMYGSICGHRTRYHKRGRHRNRQHPVLLGLTLSADACVSLVRGYGYELGSQESGFTHSRLLINCGTLSHLPYISEPQGFMCETVMRKTYLFEAVVKII